MKKMGMMLFLPRLQFRCNIFSFFTSNWYYEKVHHTIVCFISSDNYYLLWFFPGGSISIKHSQYDHYYEMTAKFNPEKTTDVDRWLDQELSARNMSFVNTRIDGEITLDDKITFYVKKITGLS